MTGSGTVTNNYGVAVAAMTKGSTINHAFYADANTSVLAGVYGSVSSGGHLPLRSTTHATKGDIQLDNPTTEWVVTNYTNTAATYTTMLMDATITMNASGGGGGTGNAFTGIKQASTLVYDQAGNALGAAVAYHENNTYKNITTEANNLGPIYSYLANPTINTDAATITASYVGYNSSLTTSQTTSGALTVSSVSNFLGTGASVGANTTVTTWNGLRVVGPTVASSGTVTTWNGLLVSNGSNSGTFTTAYGIDIASLTAASTNVAIRTNGTANPLIFSGKMTLGSTTTPTYALDIKGTAADVGVIALAEAANAPTNPSASNQVLMYLKADTPLVEFKGWA